jgi:hypothetical protein
VICGVRQAARGGWDAAQRVPGASVFLLPVLALVFFAPVVVHPGQVLYSDCSDLLALHIPAKRFLVRSWQRDGELPLWNPHSYGGAPFVHDVQGAVLYPPHLVLCLLPESWVGPALSWLVVLHLLLAGLGMFAYARDQGLGGPGALVAAAGAMFAGRWLLHLLGGGHYVTIGLAWLPLVLFCLERGVRRGGILWPSLAGALFGLLALSTQPQWTFYAGLFAWLWTFGTALECAGWWQGTRPGLSWRVALGRWALGGAWAMVLAGGLAAGALLPALEAAPLSTRAAGVDTAGILPAGLQTLCFLIGPTLTSTPAHAAWEDRGGLGLLWLLAAVLAPLLAGGRVRYQAAATACLFVFALGGAFLFQPLPGFRLFRQPARMLLVAGLPIAYLAGVSTQKLFAGLPASVLGQCRRVLRFLLLGGGILVGGFALRVWLKGEPPPFHVYWLSLMLTVPVAYWILLPATPAGGGLKRPAWMALLLLDLWALTGPLVQTRAEADVYGPSACVQYLMKQDGGPFRVLDRDQGWSPSAGSPLGTGALLAPLCGLEPVRGYSPLDVKRYKEYLQMIAGGDWPLRPFDASGLTFPVIGNQPVVHRSLLDLLGVRYLLQQASLPPDDLNWEKVLEDARPHAYVLDSGMTTLSPYIVYRNSAALPRAFVVHEAALLPQRSRVLPALLETDFRHKVLLEGSTGEKTGPATTGRKVQIAAYRPNEVVIDVGPGPPGYLVLADVWFPGWTCIVAGEDRPVYRADFLFRAVEVPAGACQAVFRFKPGSFYLGRKIALAFVGVLAIILVAAGPTYRAAKGKHIVAD